MIHLGAALLCDAATVRENVLQVLGGGLTQLRRSSFPAPLGADIALTFYIDTSDDREHVISVECRVLDSDDSIFRVEAGFRTNVPNVLGPQSVSLVVPAVNFGLPIAGQYEIAVGLDGDVLGKIPFTAVEDADGWPGPIQPTARDASSRTA